MDGNNHDDDGDGFQKSEILCYFLFLSSSSLSFSPLLPNSAGICGG